MSIADRLSRHPLGRRFDLFLRDGLSGAASSFALRVLAIGIAFLTQLLLARILGAHGTGVVALALAVAAIPTVLSVLGLDTALVRFVAVAAARRDWREVGGLVHGALKLSAAASLLGGATVFLAAPVLADDLFAEPALTLPLRLAALAIPPMALNCVLAGFLKGMGRPAAATVSEVVGVSLLWLAGLSLLSLSVGPDLRPAHAVSAYLAAALLVLASILLVRVRVTPRPADGTSRAELRPLLRSSVPLFWIASVNLIMMWADTLMLGVFLSAEEVGVYNAALRVAGFVSLALVAINSVLPPRLSALFAEGRREELQRLARQATAFLWLVSLPVVLFFVLWPSAPLRLFGAEFIDGRVPLIILTLGQFVNVATGPVGYILIMGGHERLLRNIVIAAAAINIGLNFVLIPSLGINGAATATAVSLALLNLASFALVHRRVGIALLPGASGRLLAGKAALQH